MGYCRQTSLPIAEPVSLDKAKLFVGLPPVSGPFDDILVGFIQAAREYGEILTGRSLAKRTFRQVLDSFPYYTDTVQSQQAYPPSYYSLPRYSTTLWNYSQMIKLFYAPVWSVEQIRYIATNGVAVVLHQDSDFILDRQNEPARIFPIPGSYWPASQYVANSLEIYFTAGYDPDPTVIDTHNIAANPPFQQPDSTVVEGIPQMIILGILNLVAYWFSNRGNASVISTIPNRIEQIFLNNAIVDFQPTRG